MSGTSALSRRLRQSGALALAVLAAACGGGQSGGRFEPAGEFRGAAAADEPRAALVAQEVLNRGGSAGDAAVALAFAMTATLPSRAGLGSGGACLVRGGADKEPQGISFGVFSGRRDAVPTQAITFLPQPVGAAGDVAAPLLPRALAALHARYGTLRWEQVVAPAEQLARFGTPISRALARDAAAAGITIGGENGKPLGEGDPLAQPALANTLAAIRTRGAGDLYTGDIAGAFIRALPESVDPARLRDAAPAFAPVDGTGFGDNVLYATQTPGGSDAVALWKAMARDRRADRKDPAQRAAAVAEGGSKAGLPAFAAAPGGQQEGTAPAAGFVVVDRRGAAVACSLTMGRLFGIGRLAGTTGILPAVPVGDGDAAAHAVAALLVTNDNVVQFVAGAAAGGDTAGPAALLDVMLGAAAAEQPLQRVIAEPRVVPAAAATYAEAGLTLPAAETREQLGRVSAVACPGGLPNRPESCSAAADPRGAGLAVIADKAK
ncbi:MAG TPA: gamma-glutamyltransferase [Stellaceae bacterium]